MPGETKNNNLCKAHSGILARLITVENETEAQGNKIDGMKTRSTVTLTTMVFILIGVVINLIISWPK